jgi:two-component system chemotaxis response regulator CheB
VNADASRAPSRIVVVGASAGGVPALQAIAAGLPAGLDAAVLVALHLPDTGPSALATILDNAGELPARVAADGGPLEAAAITVAPPGHHLLVEGDRIRVVRGPKVNGDRPSVDVLFHSAALAHDGRVVGVVLSGALRDGTLGLRAIKRRAGVAIVQQDALHPGMPEHAMANVVVDHVVPAHEIASTLTMVIAEAEEEPMAEHSVDRTDLEAGFDLTERLEQPGAPTVFRCPECGGSLWELTDGDASGYVCHVGHSYAADTLVDEQEDSVERAVWSAIRMLEERSVLVEGLAGRMRERGQERSALRFEEKARVAKQQAGIIRAALLDRDERGEATG